MSFMELAAAVGVACGAAVGLFTLLEKITGAGSRWLAKGVEEGTRTLREDVNDIKEEQREHKHYLRYHLGPNGTTGPVHQRLADVEQEVRGIRSEQRTIRRESDT